MTKNFCIRQLDKVRSGEHNATLDENARIRIYQYVKYIYKSFIIDYDYQKRGKDCVVFLHGWGGNKNSFDECDPFVKNFSTLKISFPPNKSYASYQALSMLDYKNIVVNILKLLNIREPIVVCHSFGCRVALLLNRDIAVKKLVICSGAGIKPRTKKLNGLNNTKKWLDNRDLHFKNVLGSTDYLALKNIDKTTFKNVVNLDLKILVKDISCPTLIYWGKRDKETPMYVCSYFHKHIEKSRCIFTNYGHFAYLENRQNFCYELKKFLGEKHDN